MSIGAGVPRLATCCTPACDDITVADLTTTAPTVNLEAEAPAKAAGERSARAAVIAAARVSMRPCRATWGPFPKPVISGLTKGRGVKITADVKVERQRFDAGKDGAVEDANPQVNVVVLLEGPDAGVVRKAKEDLRGRASP